jgi:hypothetical protein
MPDNPLINIGELSKPATVLIEKISDAIGGIFKPYQIVRVAKAEAEAEKIRTDSKIVVEDIHRRAMRRFLEEEAKKQKNIEEITQKALPNLDDDAKSEKVENDWISNFFDKCRLISDSEMQILWSRVLSGEANSPGSYSKRTVNFLSSLDKNDAGLFTKLCKFGWMIDEFTPLIYDVRNNIYNKHKINFGTLSHLESIGLIKFNDFGGYRSIGLSKKVVILYYGRQILLEFEKESGNELNIGKVFLTKIGQELAPICGSSPDQDFYEYICEKWKKEGLIKEAKVEDDSTLDGDSDTASSKSTE